MADRIPAIKSVYTRHIIVISLRFILYCTLGYIHYIKNKQMTDNYKNR